MPQPRADMVCRPPSAERARPIQRISLAAWRHCGWVASVASLALVATSLLAGCASAPERPPSAAQTLARNTSERAARSLQRGDLAGARAQYLAALDAALALQDPALIGAARLNLTAVEARRGELAAAHGHVDALLATPQRFDAPMRARAAARKALLLLDGGDGPAALQWVARARADCAAPCPLGAVLGNLEAHVALDRGDAGQALALAGTAAEQARATDQAAEQASALRLQGRAATALGQHAQADALLAQALAIDRDLGAPDRLALDLLYAGDNQARRGDAAQAAELYQRALSVYSAIGDARNAAVLRARLAQLARP